VASHIGSLGGNLKDVDLILEQAVTKETAFVQVKSKASQKVLEDYIRRFLEAGTFTRLIFACHSPKGALRVGERSDVIVWALPDFAEMVVKNGLVDWLIARRDNENQRSTCEKRRWKSGRMIEMRVARHCAPSGDNSADLRRARASKVSPVSISTADVPVTAAYRRIITST
jgi:hypothetical protein